MSKKYRVEDVQVVFFDEPDRPIDTQVVVGAVWSEKWEASSGIDDSDIFYYCENEKEFQALCDKSTPREDFYIIREENI